MFLTADELKTTMYAHIIEEITEGDSSITEQAIDAAIEEARSYLSGRYDTDRIFSAEGRERNAMILENVKVMVIWHIITICNAETIYEMWKDRYDRITAYFTKVAKGTLAPRLPLLSDSSGEASLKMRFGSHTKFNHEL